MADSRENQLANDIEGNGLMLDDGFSRDYLGPLDVECIVAALRTVAQAKAELIRETELTQRNFSLD